MPETFTIELEHINALEFNVKFGLPDVEDLRVDEPPPLGGGGPNASRLLVAAVANCLSASLLYCLNKDKTKLGAGRLKARASGELVRDDRRHLRLGGIRVTLLLGRELLDLKRLHRCLDVFQDYCVVTESVRQGIAVEVTVLDEQGKAIKVF